MIGYESTLVRELSRKNETGRIWQVEPTPTREQVLLFLLRAYSNSMPRHANHGRFIDVVTNELSNDVSLWSLFLCGYINTP